MQTHSYTGRMSPAFPFLTYLPSKPKPCDGAPEPQIPTHPHEDQHPKHGTRHTGLEPTN